MQIILILAALTAASAYQNLSSIKDYDPFLDVFNPNQQELDRHMRTSWRESRSIEKRQTSNAYKNMFKQMNRRASRKGFNVSFSTDISLEFTKILMALNQNQFRSPLQVTNGLKVQPQFCPFAPRQRCNSRSKYQSFDGTCNNLNNPLWGSIETPFKRYAAPDYDDKFSTPRRFAKSGNLLPNPRHISQIIHKDNDSIDRLWTHMFVLFGQFVTHDMTLFSTSSDASAEPIDCSCNVQRRECLQIPAPSTNDTITPCIKFTRSSSSYPTLKCNLGYREELNLLSSFLDLTQVYGDGIERSNDLRAFRGGLLRTSEGVSQGRLYLPKALNETCTRFVLPSTERVNEADRCFRAGESRPSENMGLTSVHTLFLREHNRIASELSKVNPRWTDNQLFYEARRILIGVYQHIIYDQYIQSITGDTSDQLRPKKEGYSNSYDPRVNPSLANEFSAAAMRWGHSGVKQTFGRFNAANASIGNVSFENILEIAEEAYKERGLESIMLGLVHEASSRINTGVIHTLRNQLNEKKDKYGVQLEPPIDLAAVNIQRGRDHGLPSYTKFRELCGLPTIKTFDEFKALLNDPIIDTLRTIYESMDDVDLFVGGLVESDRGRVNGSVVGPVFNCLINKQFYDLKVGDRFYYENAPNNEFLTSASAFTLPQLNEIRKMSMSSIICRNFDIERIQPNAFFVHNIKDLTTNIFFNNILAPNNTRRSCSTYADIDFTKWVE